MASTFSTKIVVSFDRKNGVAAVCCDTRALLTIRTSCASSLSNLYAPTNNKRTVFVNVDGTCVCRVETPKMRVRRVTHVYDDRDREILTGARALRLRNSTWCRPRLFTTVSVYRTCDCEIQSARFTWQPRSR